MTRPAERDGPSPIAGPGARREPSLHQLRLFLVLADELHFARAAARTAMTQPAFSQQIRALEQRLGLSLVDRASRKVVLSPAGRDLVPEAWEVVTAMARLRRHAESCARDRGEELRLAYTPSIGGDFATRVAAAFESERAGCVVTLNAVSLHQGMTPEDALRDLQADVVLVWSPGGDGQAQARQGPELTVGPVVAEVPRGLLVPSRHPLARHTTVSLEDLADQVLIKPPTDMEPTFRDLWTPRITPSGRPIRHTVDDMTKLTARDNVLVDDVLTLVARGQGLHCTVTSLLERSPFPGLTVVPIRDMPPMVIVPVWLSTADNTVIDAFAKAMTKFKNCRRTA